MLTINSLKGNPIKDLAGFPYILSGKLLSEASRRKLGADVFFRGGIVKTKSAGLAKLILATKLAAIRLQIEDLLQELLKDDVREKKGRKRQRAA